MRGVTVQAYTKSLPVQSINRYKHTLNQAILLKLYAFLTVQVDPVELLAIYAKDASFMAASGKPGFPELLY